MGKKYVTLSFDDGIEQDKKIISILKEYGIIGCTFNLNSGLAGEKRCIGRIGDFGFVEKRGEYFPDGRLMKYTPHYRIPADEIRQIYDGFEVAAHGMLHKSTINLSEKDLHTEIIGDMQALTELVGYPVAGMAYAGGMYNKKVVEFLRKNKVLYAREIKSTNQFTFPGDPLHWSPTCSMLSKDLFSLLNQFVQAEAGEDMLFYAWGHGYEFDYGSKNSNWEKFRNFCEKLANTPGLIFCTNRQIIELQKEGKLI